MCDNMGDHLVGNVYIKVSKIVLCLCVISVYEIDQHANYTETPVALLGVHTNNIRVYFVIHYHYGCYLH